jgi:small subunit ribosomal protein S2
MIMSELTQFTLRQLFTAGVHFGHHTRRWNPKMRPYIFGARDKIHIINLEQTVGCLTRALDAVRGIASSGGRVLFVGTKPQASELVKEAALRCGQYYVNHRWLGGTLTNWGTISKSIKRLKELKHQIETGEIKKYTKKEQLEFERSYLKLESFLGGIKDMGGLPDVLVVIDTNKEKIAIGEAHRLNIPVVAIIDTNSNPDHIIYPIPGNDDASRAIKLYCHLLSGAVVEGIKADMVSKGIDLGDMVQVPGVIAEAMEEVIAESVQISASE